MPEREKKRKMTAFYDSFDYQEYWQGRDYADQAEKIALKKLLRKIPQKKQKAIYDVGGGFGRLSKFFAPYFNQVTLIEPSKKLVGQAKKKLKKYHNVKFVHSKIAGLAELPEVDIVALIRVAHHLDNFPEAIEMISQKIKPNGYFILEFANKINFKARTAAFFSGQTGALLTLASVDRRSNKNIRQGSIAFLNHHPEKVTQILEKNGFSIEEKLSVSNFRSPFLKRFLPEKILLFAEKVTQRFLATINFGPSIFLLARKDKVNPN